MSEIPLVAPSSSLLPHGYDSREVLSIISSDCQVYVPLLDGRGEARVDSWNVPEVVMGYQNRLDETMGKRQERTKRAKRKGKRRRQGLLASIDWRQGTVRHLTHETRRCLDCAHMDEVVHFVWVERRCSACWSTNVRVLEARLLPERPPTFGNIGEPLFSSQGLAEKGDHKWGRSPNDDSVMIGLISNSYRDYPRHAHLYPLLLFGQALIQLPQYAADETLDSLVMAVGNVAQRYSQLTGSYDAARASLDLFERVATVSGDDPVASSVAKRAFAMTTINLLLIIDEAQARAITGRPDLRQRSLGYLRDAHSAMDKAEAMDPDGAPRFRMEVLFALAELLSLGQATASERSESNEIFEGFPAEFQGSPVRPFVRAARAQARLRSELPSDWSDTALGPYFDAAEELTHLIREATPNKLRNRWRWALEAGQFLMRMGAGSDAQPWLESAVSFILKDTAFRTEPLGATQDSEQYHWAFSVLAGHYVSIGWWFEALSLLETYRGRVIELASLTEEQRAARKEEAEQVRDERYYGRFSSEDSLTLILVEEASWERLSGHVFGPFHEDYELPGLSDRLLALFGQLADEDTVLISLSIDNTTLSGRCLVSAVLLGPPVRPPRLGRSRVWTVQEEVMRELASDIYRRPSSFREARLRRLGELIFDHLIDKMSADLRFFGCRRALLVTPSSLSNLPFEAFVPPAASARSGLPVHFAFTPSFQFRALRPPRPRRRGQEKLLVVGYEGSDLPQADHEAAMLMSAFGEDGRYLPGRECTKKRVIEELNGDYDFIHFICHGTYEAERPSESALYFRDVRTADAYRVRARELREFVHFRNEPVVTLSACSTALTADSRSNTWTGLPGSLLECGARCLIGTRWPIADRVAEEVMSQLYGLMLSTDGTPMECLHGVQDEIRDRRPTEEWACFGYLGPP
jgi:CHAT domain-containing protein